MTARGQWNETYLHLSDCARKAMPHSHVRKTPFDYSFRRRPHICKYNIENDTLSKSAYMYMHQQVIWYLSKMCGKYVRTLECAWVIIQNWWVRCTLQHVSPLIRCRPTYYTYFVQNNATNHKGIRCGGITLGLICPWWRRKSANQRRTLDSTAGVYIEPKTSLD